MHISEEFHNLKNIQKFKEYIRNEFRNQFPHEMAVCVIGDLKSRSVKRLINIDFPAKYLSYAVHPNQGIQSPLVNTWIKIRQPIIYHYQETSRELDLQFLSVIKQCKIHSIASHGIVDPYSQCFSYFTFANTGPSSKADIRASLIAFVPYLHYALTRILTQDTISENDDAPISAYEEIILSKKLDLMTSLTSRENEILNWISLGKSNSEIAVILGISHYTVNNHIKNLFKRLNVNNRAQAVSKASLYQSPVL